MKNWKTSLMGILAAMAMIFGSAAQARSNGGPPITVGNLAPAIGVAILGLVSKDHDVTGGTKQQ